MIMVCLLVISKEARAHACVAKKLHIAKSSQQPLGNASEPEGRCSCAGKFSCSLPRCSQVHRL